MNDLDLTTRTNGVTATQTTTLLAMQRVHRAYAEAGNRTRLVLDGVDLVVRPGELVAVTGRSGSGKSTLLNLAGGLDQPDTGQVLVDGHDLSSLSRAALAGVRRRTVGFVFQRGNLLPTLTALENTALPLELDGTSAREAREEAARSLAAVGLGALVDHFPDQLSGGEQQRVAIARALVGSRRLLLADEPTAALDELTAEAVMRLLRERIDSGAGGLLVTHDPAQAAWADRVVRLREGRVTETSSRSTHAADAALVAARAGGDVL